MGRFIAEVRRQEEIPMSSVVHSSALSHQFDDLEQQHESYYLGMWVFLVTEVMFFGGLFGAYTIYRFRFPAGFAEGSNHLNLVLSSTNTAVLLCSSLAVALAVRGAQVGKQKVLIGFLLLTILLGSVFLGLKGVEYYQEFEEHLIPGLNFSLDSPNASQVELFFVLYFTMTGLHAIHMIIGITVMFILVILSWRNWFSPDYYAPVEMAGLYWHFVDIVWVFLFPLLYLISRHP
jgi:cytochrome c oxidase subunit 3